MVSRLSGVIHSSWPLWRSTQVWRLWQKCSRTMLRTEAFMFHQPVSRPRIRTDGSRRRIPGMMTLKQLKLRRAVAMVFLLVLQRHLSSPRRETSSCFGRRLRLQTLKSWLVTISALAAFPVDWLRRPIIMMEVSSLQLQLEIAKADGELRFSQFRKTGKDVWYWD